MEKKENINLAKRKFLFQGGKSLAALAAANVAVYVVGSAFKELDGSLVAGAKCSNAHVEGDRCWHGCSPPSGGLMCSEWVCVGSSWFCTGDLGTCGGACY